MIRPSRRVSRRSILNTATEADYTHPELEKKVLAGILQWKRTIIGLMAKGIEEKAFSDHVNFEQTALTIIVTNQEAVMIA